MIPPNIAGQLAKLGIIETELVTPGMSGAVIFRCRRRHEPPLALKQWPGGTTTTRVDQVHRIMIHSRAAGCEIVPTLLNWPCHPNATRCTEAGSHWELMQWMPGHPLSEDASPGRIGAGAAAIARFHRSVADMGVRIEVPPAILNRLHRLRELHQIVPQLRLDRELDPRLQPVVQSACQLLAWKWTGLRLSLEQMLQTHAERAIPIQWVLRDVHRGHVLFEHDHVSGLIDFDAIRCDTPLTDLARWVSDFVVGRDDQVAIWDSAAAGFFGNVPEDDRAGVGNDLNLVRCLVRASLWISLANWLDWILLQRRTFAAGPEKIAERLKILVHGAIKDGEGELW
jgi:Ser/Thr protein kinase RdoA (MazF antagonist)